MAVHGDGTILRRKDRGIWKEITWAELGARARRVGMALKALGFRAGDVAAVLAETSPDWVYTDLGILGAGGISAGIDPTDAASQVAHLLHDCGARFLFVENEEQLDKVLETRERCPALERIVIFDMIGLCDLVDPMCEDLDTFLARGAVFDGAHPDEWEGGIAAIEGGQTAILVYTSGTTGRPKDVMLSHDNILFQVVNASRLLDQHDGDERLAFLPMCHVAERIAGIYQALYTGTISNYVEGPETVAENLREVQPTIMGAVPDFWERFHSRIQIAIDDATWAQRIAYRWAIGVGGRMADAQRAGRSPSVPLRLEYALASRLVLRNVRRELGLDRVRWASVGVTPTSPEQLEKGVPNVFRLPPRGRCTSRSTT
jgi:long-chain acyl-CoA synthetase